MAILYMFSKNNKCKSVFFFFFLIVNKINLKCKQNQTIHFISVENHTPRANFLNHLCRMQQILSFLAQFLFSADHCLPRRNQFFPRTEVVCICSRETWNIFHGGKLCLIECYGCKDQNLLFNFFLVCKIQSASFLPENFTMILKFHTFS